MKRYLYGGPVTVFGMCVNRYWEGETVASSLSKARSNLTYQYKKRNGWSKDSNVKLTGKIREVE